MSIFGLIASVNPAAVLMASVAAFVLGGLYFGPKTMFPVWWRAMGRPEDQDPAFGMHMGVVFGATYAGQLVQALTLGLLLQLVSASGTPVGAIDGAIIGLIAGAGIGAASSLSHRLFAGHGFAVWAIEVASDVLNLTVMGAILGAWP